MHIITKLAVGLLIAAVSVIAINDHLRISDLEFTVNVVNPEHDLTKRISDLEAKVNHLEYVISNVATLAHFGDSITCDPSKYIKGSVGMAAHEALKLTSICDPKERPKASEVAP